MKKISIQETINSICETAPGRFRIILYFAIAGIVKHLLRDDYKYVWVHNHLAGAYSEWKEFELPIPPTIENKKIIAWGIRYDVIIETSEFRKLLPD